MTDTNNASPAEPAEGAPAPDANDASPAEQAAAALLGMYPALRQDQPKVYGARTPLSQVDIPHTNQAVFTWGQMDVEVVVSHEDHLDRENPDNTDLHRFIRATAKRSIGEHTLTEFDRTPYGEVEWQMRSPQTWISFPPAMVVAPADKADPRFTSAVLEAVGKALDYARASIEHLRAPNELA